MPMKVARESLLPDGPVIAYSVHGDTIVGPLGAPTYDAYDGTKHGRVANAGSRQS